MKFHLSVTGMIFISDEFFFRKILPKPVSLSVHLIVSILDFQILNKDLWSSLY